MARTIAWSWRSAAAASVLLGVCALLGAISFAGTETALRWIAARAAQASAGRLTLEDVSGSLYGPVRIGKLAFADGGRRIEGRGLALDWSPLELLLNRAVQIRSIELQSLVVNTGKPDGGPPQLPQTLRLPLRLEIGSAKINSLVLAENGRRQEFRALALKLDNPSGRFHAAASLDTPWGRGVSEFTLSDAAPFALDGSAGLADAGGKYAHSVSATLKGTLASIEVTAMATAKGARAELSARITPFASMPLKLAALHLEGVDARKFEAGLPRTDLSAEFTLRAQPENLIAGELKLTNGVPGSVDAALLPLRAAQLVFEGSPAALSLTGVDLNLGDAGRFTGKGSLREAQLALDLTTPAFDMRGIYAKLAATKLVGRVELGVEGSAQHLRADLRQEAYNVHVDASHRDHALQVHVAKISVAGGELSLNGSISLAEQRAFRAEGKLSRFDPSRLGDYPAALINGAFSASGRLSARPEAALKFSLADSRYRGRPLQGSGKAKLVPGRIWDSSIALALGANRLSASGAFGAAGDGMDWQMEAANLGELAAELGGRLSASGRLEGTMEEPSGAFRAEARNLAWAGKHRVAEFTAEGKIDKGIDGPLALAATLRDYRSNVLQLQAASVAAKGRRSEHELSIAARNTAIDLRAAFAGGWQAGAGWSGRILSFDNSGRYAAVLEAPARVTVQGADFSLGAASLRFARGSVRIAEITRRGGSYYSDGVLSGIDSDYLLGLIDRPQQISSTLTLGGHWKLAAAETINGVFELHREQGDLTALSEPTTAVGLNRLNLSATAVEDRISAKLDAAGAVLGAISASASTTLSRQGASVGLSGNSALSFDAEVSVPSLAWIMPLMGERMVIDGRLQGKFSGAGTVAQPVLSGSISADALKFEYPEQGMYLKDGSVRASLQENRLLLERLVLHGGEGLLEGSGSIAWESGKIDARAALTANKLEVLRHLDRHLVLSGNAEARLQDGHLHTSATLKADRGEIALPGTDAPTLSSDVVVLGRDDDIKESKSRFAAEMELNLDLGEQFRLKGRGLEARLAGAVNVRAKTGAPTTASGSIRVAEGSYSAYGHRLVIDRGVLNFAGPLDNPGLDIIALRKNQEVEAGVAIRGTALAPQISLVSNPPVPDNEKLSWLVLGHGLEGSSRSDLGLLQTAAGALLARGEAMTLQNRIASATGLDEISLGAETGANGLESATLNLGKRLSSRAYLTVEQGIGASMRLVKISYALTQRISLRVETGTDSAVDAFYTFSFK